MGLDGCDGARWGGQADPWPPLSLAGRPEGITRVSFVLTHVLRCYNWVARYIYKRKKGGVSYVYSRKPFQGIHVNPVRVYAKEMSLADRYNDQNRLLMSTTIARRPKFRIGREFRENKRRFLGFTSWDNIR